MKQHCTVILASTSPRRKELLESWGIHIHVRKPNFDESAHPVGESAPDFVSQVARGKLTSVLDDRLATDVLIASDTVVVSHGEILGKPSDMDQVKGMLMKLSGETHQVLTAYCIQQGEKLIEKVVTSDVTMHPIGPDLLDHYCKVASPMDKAGAYGIQEHAGMFVAGIRGSLTNIIGLPMQEIFNELLQMKVLSF